MNVLRNHFDLSLHPDLLQHASYAVEREDVGRMVKLYEKRNMEWIF
jgi:hypothetical protein